MLTAHVRLGIRGRERRFDGPEHVGLRQVDDVMARLKPEPERVEAAHSSGI